MALLQYLILLAVGALCLVGVLLLGLAFLLALLDAAIGALGGHDTPPRETQ